MTAASNVPWSVKGIDPRTREVAKDLARRNGMTLGEYLNTLITSGGEAGPAAEPHADSADSAQVTEALARLSARIEAAERRSSSAITGVDQSVQSVLARLQAAEQSHTAALGRIDTVEREVRADRLVVGEVTAAPVEAVKSLETSIGKIAAQVYAADERNGLALSKIVERLERAEAQTTSAVRRLESSFAGLDQRLGTVEQNPAAAGGGVSESRFEQLAAELHARMDSARAEMTQTLERAAEGRFDQMERVVQSLTTNVEAAERRSHKAIEKLGHEVLRVAETLGKRMVQVENRSADAIEQVGGEVSRIAGAMETRAKVSDNAHAQALERLGEEIARISERLAERIAASERRSAQAIDDVGDQVLRATDKLNTRYDRASSDLADRIRASEERTARFLDEARERMDARLSEPHRRGSAQPAYRAPDALARFEALDEADPASPFVSAGGPTRARLLRRPGAPTVSTPFVPEPAAEPEQPSAWSASASAEPEVVETIQRADWSKVEADPIPAFLAPENEPLAPEAVAPPPAAAEPAPQPEVVAAPEPELEPELELQPAPPPVEAPEPEEEPAIYELAAPEPTPAFAEFHPDEDTFDPGNEFEPAPTAAAATAQPAPEQAYESLDEFGDLVAFEHVDASPAGEPAPVPSVEEYGEPALPVMTELSPPMSTRDVLDRARAAARSGAAPRTAPRQAALAARAPAQPAAAKSGLLGGLRLPSLGKSALRRDSTLRTALIASATAAALSVFFASWTIFNDDKPEADAAAVAEAQPRGPTPRLASLRVEPAASADAGAVAYARAKAELSGNNPGGLATLKQAASLGHPQAQLHLASLYESGAKGVAKDAVEARRWTERAAQSGDRRAMHNLGLLYFEGIGGSKDMTLARQWFRRAADRGLSDSQYNIGLINENGYGVTRNPAEAYKWYLIAARSGDKEARGAAERLERALSAPAKTAAERAALSFRAEGAGSASSAVAALATPDVAAAQRALFRLGYYKGPADGRASPALREALMAWQQASGVVPDGIIDADAITALSAAG